MPQVLVNPESGLAETFEPNDAMAKLQSGYHVPLHDNQGNSFSAPFQEAQQLVQSGQMRQPTPDELGTWVNKGVFGTPSQQAVTYIEGAAKGLAGPLAPMIETAMGVKPESILARAKVNPGTKLAGEMTTTIGGAILMPEFSLPGLIGKAGSAATAGIAAEGVFGALAKKAVDGAVQGALYESQNKIHEGVLGDSQAVGEHILSDIGLSAALGGGLSAAFGGASKLAKAGIESAGNLAEKASEFGENLYDRIPVADSPLKQKGLDFLKYSAGKTIKAAAYSAHPGLAAAYDIAKWGAKLAPGALKDSLMDSLIAIKQSSNKAIDTIDKNAGAIFGFGASKIVGDDTSDSEFHSLHESSQDHASNPDGLAEHLTEGLSAIQEHAPGVSTALTATISNAVNYLDSKRPPIIKNAPLDTETPIPQYQKANYNHTASIVDSPMRVFGHLKDGTLLPIHLEALQTVYPSVYQQMKDSVNSKMVDFLATHDAHEIPYQTKLGLSQFLGQPLDSTMTPQAIFTNHVVLAGNQVQQQQQQAAQSKPSKSGMGKMKLAENDKTSFQRSQTRSS